MLLRLALLAQFGGSNSSFSFWLQQKADEAYRLASGNKLLFAGAILGVWGLTKLMSSDLRK